MEKLIGWKFPSTGWIKANSEGALTSKGWALAIGLLRNEHGIGAGDSPRIWGISLSLMQSYRGALLALQTTWDRGYQRVLVEIDNLRVLRFVMIHSYPQLSEKLLKFGADSKGDIAHMLLEKNVKVYKDEVIWILVVVRI
ncbi:hypothetical protein Sjap_002249 [Stephania japonica]|uniref:RNase H type-1 domain-containing protein n=1 Tax=Stephania japonica TaxID=461633 RepID=A0AAP0KNV7_9MAGN